MGTWAPGPGRRPDVRGSQDDEARFCHSRHRPRSASPGPGAPPVREEPGPHSRRPPCLHFSGFCALPVAANHVPHPRPERDAASAGRGASSAGTRPRALCEGDALPGPAAPLLLPARLPLGRTKGTAPNVKTARPSLPGGRDCQLSGAPSTQAPEKPRGPQIGACEGQLGTSSPFRSCSGPMATHCTVSPLSPLLLDGLEIPDHGCRFPRIRRGDQARRAPCLLWAPSSPPWTTQNTPQN